MKLRVARPICSPRQSMTERGVFIALVATVLHRLSQFVSAQPGIAQIYLAYAIGFISTLNTLKTFSNETGPILSVGAGLLANAVYLQRTCRLALRLREQARSHREYGACLIRKSFQRVEG